MLTNMLVDPTHGGSGLGQAIGNTCDMMVTMARILMGGVAERFPRLTFLFVESGGGWVPTQLERMDEQVELFWLEAKWLKLKPSEYFKRQCYVSFDPGEWNLAASAEWLGADRILWASDFPHPEYSPEVVKTLKKHIAPLSEADQHKILAQNAIDAYRLPIKAS
jgi:predicted TIM-barrel fold metal-dependent hydrolase